MNETTRKVDLRLAGDLAVFVLALVRAGRVVEAQRKAEELNAELLAKCPVVVPA